MTSRALPTYCRPRPRRSIRLDRRCSTPDRRSGVVVRYRERFDENRGRDVKADQHGQRDNLARGYVLLQFGERPIIDRSAASEYLGIFKRDLFFRTEQRALRPTAHFSDLLFGNAGCAGKRHVTFPFVIAINNLRGAQDDDFGERAGEYGLVAKG